LEAAYVGSRGDHLVIKTDINVAKPTVGVSNSDVNRPFIVLAPALRSLSQVQSRGYNIYHSLQTKFSKRFSNGFSFINSFTWGKNIDIASDTENATLNPYDFKYDRAVSDFDVPKYFTSSVNYELPFGKGKKFGATAGGGLDKVIRGWQINWLLLARSGLPFSVTQQQGMLSNGTGNRPYRIASGELSNPTPDRWWDTAAFVPTSVMDPAGYTGVYGNSGRNILRGPNQINLDISLMKVTRFRERFEHQFRFEVFNAMNHPQFANPGNQLGSSTQGVITALLNQTPMRQIQFAMKLGF